jgi:hypothetical protein
MLLIDTLRERIEVNCMQPKDGLRLRDNLVSQDGKNIRLWQNKLPKATYPEKKKKKKRAGVAILGSTTPGTPILPRVVPINEHTPRCVNPISVVSLEDAYCLPCLR